MQTSKAGFQETLLFFSFFGVWEFSLSRYLIQAAISGASRYLSKNARQTGDTISSNINTLNNRYRKGALEGGKGLKLDHVKPCVIPHRMDIKKGFITQIVYLGHQGCIICSILPSGMGARGVSSEHVEDMEMFSCSPT